MKTLFLDLETSPNLAFVWGLWNQNIAINQLAASTEVICFGARWLGEDEVIFRSTKHHGKDRMLNKLHQIIDEADIVIGWNSKAFDSKHIKRELLQNGYKPPSPYRDIDLMLTVKQNFKFPSNKLDYVAQTLGVGQKTPHTGFQLWLDCMAGKRDAWQLMREYQIQDVNLLVDLYQKLLPWINGLNNTKTGNECPNCGSTNIHQKGIRHNQNTTYLRHQCQNCGKWLKGKMVKNNQYKHI